MLILFVQTNASVTNIKKIKHELTVLYDQLDVLKATSLNEIERLREQFQDFK